jgi:thiol-disulfide isomerase/thioredoxin
VTCRRLALTALLVLFLGACRKEASTTTGTSGAAARPSPTMAVDSPEPGAPLEVGQKFPEYEAKWMDGSSFRLGQRRDKVVLLNIWATWCGPCRYEIPELQQMHEKFGSKGFEVVGVSIDDPGTEENVREFVKREKIAYPVVLDPQGRIADLLQTTVIPTSALIARDGTILWMHRGIVSASDERLTAALNKAL